VVVTDNDHPSLRDVLAAACEEHGVHLKDLTVLTPTNDPFRQDTDGGRENGAWLARNLRDLGLADRRIHVRGLHYALLGRPKPDGSTYVNDDNTAGWLGYAVAKPARWLGFIPFDQIVDERNDEPVVRVRGPEIVIPPYVSESVGLTVPDRDEVGDITPLPSMGRRFEGRQRYRLLLFGEKTSLEDVLAPISNRYDTDLYLPTGEASDTLLHRIAQTGAEDGRSVVVFTFSDGDPAGWQMPISIGRKLQAFKASLFPALEFQVRRVCLKPDQVRRFDLPVTPLKDTERRADKWREAMGVEQTEIDALATLRPELLREIATDALDQFYDHSLQRRVAEVRGRWHDEAKAKIAERVDSDEIDRVHSETVALVDALRQHVDETEDTLRDMVDEVELPDVPEVPAPEVDSDPACALVDSSWSFVDQCRRLIESKAYRNGDGS
jgi:hypothetical protein